MKSGNLNFFQPSGPLQACNGTALPFFGKIEKNEMDGACSTYEGEERRIQGFGGENVKKETIWETQA